MKNETCSYCEFYIPDTCCEQCNEYVGSGECEVADFDDKGNFISGNEYVGKRYDDPICERFKIREETAITGYLDRCGWL